MFKLGESFEAMKEKDLKKFFSNITFADLYTTDEDMALTYLQKKTEKIIEYLCKYGKYLRDTRVEIDEIWESSEITVVKEIIIQNLIHSFRTWEEDNRKYGKILYTPRAFNLEGLSRYDTFKHSEE